MAVKHAREVVPFCTRQEGVIDVKHSVPMSYEVSEALETRDHFILIDHIKGFIMGTRGRLQRLVKALIHH